MHCYCRALDLTNDPIVWAEYDEWQRKVWTEVLLSLQEAGIQRMEIYRADNRLFLIVEAGDDFSLERKAALDAANPKVQDWEKLMWDFQVALPSAKPGQKWVLMEKVFEL